MQQQPGGGSKHEGLACDGGDELGVGAFEEGQGGTHAVQVAQAAVLRGGWEEGGVGEGGEADKQKRRGQIGFVCVERGER